MPAAAILAAWTLACGTPEAAEEGRAGAPAAQPGRSDGAAVQLAVDHVLLITIDTLRADALGFMGNREVETPALDRLAAGGRVYDDAHAHNVVTLPSHANILTGLHPFEHGVRDNAGFRLPTEPATAATLLGEAGFATAAVVGAFPLAARYGLDRGFGLYDDELPVGARPTDFVPAERRGDAVVERGRAWWQANRDRRRFLWLHLFDPHAPYEPAEPFASRYRGSPYLGEVAAVDAYLSPLLEPFLEGREAPTLIVFTSDHGEALGDHGELTHGLFAYEATLRVPLVLWAPGLAAGRSRRPARHVDLLPTILAAAGVEPPAGLAGRSLLAAAPEAHGATYFESLTPALDRGWAPLRGVVVDGWKLIALPLPELYDLARDPAESNNLYDEERPRARRMAAALPAESAWPPARGATTASERAALRSLGYLGGGAAPKTSYGPADDPKNLVHLDRKVHRVVDLYQRRDLAAAEALAREVVAERPDMAVARYYLSQVLLEAGRPAEALEVMQAARRAGAASPALLRQLGLTLAEGGRFGEALELLAPLARDPDPEALRALGLVLSEAGRQGEARAALERALELDAGSPLALQGLALVALRGGQWSEAERRARAALEASPELAPAWNYLGSALYNRGRKGEALEALERAARLDPRDFDALYNAGVVALELGERQRARAALERFVEQAPAERYGPDLDKARRWLRDL